ncbi:MAG TPA: hypothetical protein VMT50_08030 [Steroidobacteraceae bacterium]|nr:hypothetical protein [Steroidobacteraceae bacterium]
MGATVRCATAPWAWCAAGLLLAAPVAIAQPVETAATVEAKRLSVDQQVHQFVEEITRGVADESSNRRDDESPAIWHRPLCPLVAGLARPQAEFLLERISAAARAAGAPLDEPQCHRPNLFVVVTSDPARFLAAWRRRDHDVFGGAAGANIRHFIESPRPVRAWYNLVRVGADTASAVDGTVPLSLQRDLKTSPDVGRMPNSRLERATVLGLDSVIVVVQAGRATDLPARQLADYVAMISLVELRADRDFAAVPTVLGLFGVPPTADAPRELSTWDQTFLSAVYHTEQKYTLQRSQIARRMLNDASH